MNFNHCADEKMSPIRNGSRIIFVIVLLAYCSYAAKPKFRSKTGCCICWTKSQTGKPFLRSQYHKERFLKSLVLKHKMVTFVVHVLVLYEVGSAVILRKER